MVRYIFALFTALGLPTIRQENTSMNSPFFSEHLCGGILGVLAREQALV